ncbi:Beta-glucuronidase [subsurface metagenome]
MKISLNGNWSCEVDKEDIGKNQNWFKYENFISKKNLTEIKIPISFNILKEYENFEGIFWHYFLFDFDQQNKDVDVFIEFEGSNYFTEVWLNNEFLGDNEGGFLPFKFKIKKIALLKAQSNFLTVRVDNIRRKDGIPGLFFDWFNWGGIYRDVNLIILRKNRLEKVRIKTLLPSRKKSLIRISYRIKGSLNFKWSIIEPDKKDDNISIVSGTKPNQDNITITINNPKLWSPDSPKLYKFIIKPIDSGNEREILFQTKFGIRQIVTKGIYLYLNKQRIKIKGASLHEEYMPYGRTIPYEKREEDIKNMKSFGFNALRTAHYSHDEKLMDAADKLGILILEEIPLWGFCNFGNPKTFKLAAKMLKRLIERDYNHPSVIWWSVGNEVPIQQPNCSRFMRRLMEWVRMHDDTRLVTYVSYKFFIDLTQRKADIAAVNVYLGWYYARVNQLNFMADAMRAIAPKKPWIFTEFGAGAKIGFKAGWKNQVKFSEERQVRVLDYTIRTLNSKDYIAGWFIWIYRDFRSLMRTNQFQQGYNRKGIVSEKNERKLIIKLFPEIVNEQRKVKNLSLLGSLLTAYFFPLLIIGNFIFDFFILLSMNLQYKRGVKKD